MRRKLTEAEKAAELAENDRIWFEKTVPEWHEKSELIADIISLTRELMRLSPAHRRSGVRTLLECWDHEFEMLTLYALGSEGETAKRAKAALEKRKEVMDVLWPKAVRYLKETGNAA